MSKAQNIWNAAYPITVGQVIEPGTEVVVPTLENGVVLAVSVFEVFEEITAYGKDVNIVRTVEPMPDPDDTGGADFYVYDDCVDIENIVVSRQQARNFARLLKEALDG